MELDSIKIGMIGDPMVGKTALTQIYITDGMYPRDYHLTTGAEIFGKVQEGEKDTKVIIYDFSGKDLYYRQIVKPMLKKIDRFLFVYDCTNRNSFDNLKKAIEKIEELQSNIQGAIISNKNDFHQKEVEEEEGQELAEKYNIEFYQTSIEEIEQTKNIFLSIISK